MEEKVRTLILTAKLDERSQRFFEELRQRHYPAELNRIGAHLTMFHTLPDGEETRAAVRAAAARVGFGMRVTGLRSLGRGVAYSLESAELMGVQRGLAGQFAEVLSAQDKQKFVPHVVVQNKADSAKAKELKALLGAGFRAFEVRAEGLELWYYLGGPWKLAETFLFEAGE